jgi:hypothetical protein
MSREKGNPTKVLPAKLTRQAQHTRTVLQKRGCLSRNAYNFSLQPSCSGREASLKTQIFWSRTNRLHLPPQSQPRLLSVLKTTSLVSSFSVPLCELRMSSILSNKCEPEKSTIQKSFLFVVRNELDRITRWIVPNFKKNYTKGQLNEHTLT